MVNYICDFEVHGKVQGVFFRKYTWKTAKSLALKGWCMNTQNKTVKGQLEGSDKNIKQMQDWLSNIGSPKSIIHKAEFTELKPVSESQFENFTIRK